MPTALIACLAGLALLMLAGWVAWREHDRLILLAWRAEEGPEDERVAARAAFSAQISRPGMGLLARWMGLMPR